jgi:type III pantothenate kinase
MIMLLDAGNSRFKWARLQGGLLSDVSSQEYGSHHRAQAAASALEASDVPRRIVVASVLGDDFREQFTRVTDARFGLKPEFVVPAQSGYGVRVGYVEPQQFGADRFAALVAARQNFRQPCLVVDCGTAVTIDALSASGEHLGGLIIPGFDLMCRSLIKHTARINFTFQSGDDHLFGRSTSQGVTGGTWRALINAINGIVQEMTVYITEHRHESPVNYLMTGGAGSHVLPHLAVDYHLESRLVLHGLAIIAQGSAPGSGC